MFAPQRKALLSVGFFLMMATAAFAQTTTMEGDVKDAGGQPLKGALITLDRTDIKGHYTVKSDKRGHWFYMGLPSGTFDISCTVDGKVMDSVKGVKSKYGDSVITNFDLHQSAASQQANQAAALQAAQNGTVPTEQEKGMTKEQKAQFEAAAKKASEQMKKNKALNDAFNTGMDSMKKAQADTDNAGRITDYKASVDSLTTASTLDPNQQAVWANLALANYSLGQLQTGDEKTKSLDAAIANYQKSSALKPDDASVYIQIGNAYAAEKKYPEAEQALTKATQLDPTMAGKAYFNMGANLVNAGHPEQASEFFKKSADAAPDNAESWYQLGSTLAMKGTVDPKTGAQSYPDGTAEAYQKYLQLQPNGPHAQEATAMLQALGAKVETKVSIPQAKAKKK